MSESTLSASIPVTCQAPVSMPLPTYDWDVADQMHKFRLFKCQVDTWFWLHKIKVEEHLDYLLCILGKEGYAAKDHWVPPDEVHKQDPEKFLKYLESTLDNEISPQVRVYALEDVKKRSDESVDEFIDRICQLTCHVQIGNGSDATIEFEVQCRLIQVIPDANIELQKELLKLYCEKRVSNLLEICHVLHHCVWSSNVHNVQNAPILTPLAMTTAQCGMLSAKAVPRKFTSMPSATALVLLANSPPSPM